VIARDFANELCPLALLMYPNSSSSILSYVIYPVLIAKLIIGYSEIKRNAMKQPREAYEFKRGSLVV